MKATWGCIYLWYHLALLIDIFILPNEIKDIYDLAIVHDGTMKNTYCLFQIKFITDYTNVQHIIITQI